MRTVSNGVRMKEKSPYSDLRKAMKILDDCIGDCSKATAYSISKVWDEIDYLEDKNKGSKT